MSVSTWILDTPALNAYARGSIFVAALISTVSREDAMLLVPTSCLMRAHATADDTDLLDLLTSFDSVHAVPLNHDTARTAGQHWRTHPDAPADAAHAASLATNLNAPIVTDHATRLAGLLPPDHLIYTLPE